MDVDGGSGDDPVAVLVRAVSRDLLDPALGDGVRADVEAAVLARADAPFQDDPALAREVVESTRQNLRHWLRSIGAAPYEAVPPDLAPAVLGIAREAIRRGADRNIWVAYGAGRDTLWRHWMRLSFARCADAEVLGRTLDLVLTSLTDWTDATIAQLAERVESERAELTRGTHTQKLEAVTLLLDGAPIDGTLAGERLGYRLAGAHLAVVLWTDPGAPDRSVLDRAAEVLRRRSGARAVLTVAASSSSLWVWLGGAGCDPQPLTRELQAAGAVRGGVGSAGQDVDGFRRSHFEAVAVQRLMMRTPTTRAASYDDVALAVLVSRDEQAAHEYVARFLGPLAGAAPELRETVRVYIRERYSASRTAAALFTHRNTVLNRLQRAETLLPEPLATRGLEIGTALEISRWLGRGR